MSFCARTAEEGQDQSERPGKARSRSAAFAGIQRRETQLFRAGYLCHLPRGSIFLSGGQVNILQFRTDI